MTAQELYAEMMKLRIAPQLRELGFVGSSQKYRLPSESHWPLLSYQKSHTSTRELIRFTINLLVVSKADWNAYRANPLNPLLRSLVPERPRPDEISPVG